MKKTPLIVIAVLATIITLGGIIALAGQGDSNDSMSPDSTAPSEMTESMNNSDASTMAPADAVAATEVSIEDYKFGPQNIKVKVGTTVTWTNNDSVRHNVAGINNDLPAGKLIGRGETYTYTFTKAGVYKYLCEPHPYMKASVTVTE